MCNYNKTVVIRSSTAADKRTIVQEEESTSDPTIKSLSLYPLPTKNITVRKS